MFLVDPWIIRASFHVELIASFELSSGLCLVLVFLVEIYEQAIAGKGNQDDLPCIWPKQKCARRCMGSRRRH